MSRTITWVDKVKSVDALHVHHLKENASWRVEDTASELKLSIGRVSEYLTLAVWMLKDPKVQKQSTIQDALDYVRKRKEN